MATRYCLLFVLAALAACGTSYRPADNITRAEMASMVKELLDHTNARPAGVTIQPTSASGVAGTIATTISVSYTHLTLPTIYSV